MCKNMHLLLMILSEVGIMLALYRWRPGGGESLFV
uniref:Uncharacterized protein n=1 Tax=Anguilla anguilla TaxID=7936 RepID=A0A0E9U424_ANGAN